MTLSKKLMSLGMAAGLLSTFCGLSRAAYPIRVLVQNDSFHPITVTLKANSTVLYYSADQKPGDDYRSSIITDPNAKGDTFSVSYVDNVTHKTCDQSITSTIENTPKVVSSNFAKDGSCGLQLDY